AAVVSVFCSSRRRRTISARDWSSDVCSSDLFPTPRTRPRPHHTDYGSDKTDTKRCHMYCLLTPKRRWLPYTVPTPCRSYWTLLRSEERRVGTGARVGRGAGRSDDSEHPYAGT